MAQAVQDRGKFGAIGARRFEDQRDHFAKGSLNVPSAMRETMQGEIVRGIRNVDAIAIMLDIRNDRSGVDGECRRFGISANKTACAKQNAAEVSRYDEQAIGERLLLQDVQHRPSCRTARFTIIARAFCPCLKAIRIAVMTSIRMGGSKRSEDRLCVRFFMNRAQVREKARFLLFIDSIDSTSYRAKGDG